jgi:hypothetical protein
MMQPSALPCVIYAPPSTGCCDPPALPPVAPIVPFNAAGLSAIRYRIGTFTSFRRAMLDTIPSPDLLRGLANPNIPPNPFAAWREGMDDDYQTTFVELWAYLADILTFYQERIANEAYLPTATQRDSLLRLAQLIDYRPNPGAASAASVAFFVEPKKTVAIPSGFRIGARPQPGTPPLTFEVAAAIQAIGEHSAIPVAQTYVADQFAASIVRFGIVRSGIVQVAMRTVVLQGTATRLSAGDYVLLVANATSTSPSRYLRQLVSVAVDPKARITTVSWSEVPVLSYTDVKLYALRLKVAPLGSRAPAFDLLPSTLTNTDQQHPKAIYNGRSWDDPKAQNTEYYLPAPDDDAGTKCLYLDAVYAAATGSSDRQGWVALLADNQTPAIFSVTDARPVTKLAYALTAHVTRLTLTGENGTGIPSGTFPIRSTLVLTGAEELPIQTNLPLPKISGTSIVLDGRFPQLQAGQLVVIRGPEFDSKAQVPTTIVAAETNTIAAAPLVDPAGNTTTIQLKTGLVKSYVPAGTTVLANVTSATQGETVRNEILGSGAGTANQTFALKQQPLTYLPSTDPASPSPVTSTLMVTVNQVRWNEQPTLLNSAANAQDFTTWLDDTGQTTVTFGDGANGARPPTGTNNIRARYRKGLGAAGNVAADTIQRLVDSAPGLKRVTNPTPAFGGADRERLDQIRVNAPASVRTFGRAVSADDYAAVALTYPSVAKATAAWVRFVASTDSAVGPVRLVAVPQPYVQLTVAVDGQQGALDSEFKRSLRAFLDARRDPNVPLRIAGYAAVLVDLEATVDIDDHYARGATVAAALAALSPVNPPGAPPGYFAFARLAFGESIYLSAIYAALQAVPGVRDATIATLRRLPQDPDPTPAHDIFIRPTELAVIQTASGDSSGQLAITWGTGGYVDT